MSADIFGATLWQKFTPEEQACISKKIRKNMDEGKPQEQAIAIAISQCAPGKVRKTATGAWEFASEQFVHKPSQGYDAEQAADGTWTVYDVPIFAAHVDDRGEKPLKFDRSWLEKALSAGKVRHAEGYFPPVHVRHHGHEGVKAAGKLRFSRIGEIGHGGKPIAALFADLVGIQPESYEEIRSGKLSYRSVEILDVKKAEIDSLALLDDEVPFFRFPLLRVRSETRALKKGAAPALAYRAGYDSSAAEILFSFKGEDVPDPDETKTEEKTFAAEEVLAKIMALLEKMAAKMGLDEEEEEEEGTPPPEPPQMQAGPVEVGVTKAEETGAKSEGREAALIDKVQALESKLEAMEAGTRMSAKASKLREAGFAESQVDKFLGIAKKRGEAAALSYAEGMEQVGPHDPPATWTGEIHAQEPDPKEVAHYSQQGPEALEEARSIWGTWKKAKSDVDLKTYIETNMEFAGLARTGREG